MTFLNPTMADVRAPMTRLAIYAIFLMHGLIAGSWAAQIPFHKVALGVGPAQFSIILFSVAAGAVLSMPLAGGMIGRLGMWPVLTALSFANAFCLVPVSLAPGFVPMAIAGLLIGSTTGALDVAMNAMGVKVERGYGKPIMSALHGTWSIGVFIGVSVGSFLVTQTSPVMHAVLVALVGCVLALANTRLRIEGDDARAGPLIAVPSRVTIGVGMLAFLALMLEGAMVDWAAIYLKTERAVSPAIAGYGLAVFSGAMAIVRFGGDALRHRFGATAIVIASSLLAAAGMVLSALAPSLPLILAGFVCAGVGIGNVAPILFAAGGIVDKEAPARGIAAVTTLAYAGFLVGPPLIGLIAEYSAFSVAFVLLALMSVGTALVANRVLKPHLG
jgi:predicted MFS family arabinose efflux permease